MTEVTCEIIPLYKFAIDMKSDDKKDSWDEYIISDTIAGIQKRIIEWEINCGYNIANFRKRLIVSDFLLMPCESNDCKTAYKLFDIENHDCVELFGASHDEEYYYCMFDDDRPIPVMNPFDDEIFLSKIKCVLTNDKNDDAIDHMIIEVDIEEGFARVLYNSTLNHPYRRELINKQKSDDDCCDKLINVKMQQMIHIEESVKSNNT